MNSFLNVRYVSFSARDFVRKETFTKPKPTIKLNSAFSSKWGLGYESYRMNTSDVIYSVTQPKERTRSSYPRNQTLSTL